jgi:hypothetical protein
VREREVRVNGLKEGCERLAVLKMSKICVCDTIKEIESVCKRVRSGRESESERETESERESEREIKGERGRERGRVTAYAEST